MNTLQSTSKRQKSRIMSSTAVTAARKINNNSSTIIVNVAAAGIGAGNKGLMQRAIGGFNPSNPGETAVYQTPSNDAAASSVTASEGSAQSLTGSFTSLFSLPSFQYDGNNIDKLVIPLAGVTLLSGFLLVLIVNYFLHMRRNGFFKRHRVRTRLVDTSGQNKSSENNSSSADRERLMGTNKSLSYNNTGELLDATPDVYSNSELPIDQILASLDLPPMPSPQLEYRPLFQTQAQQQLLQMQQQQQQQQQQQMMDRTPPSPTPLLPQRLTPQFSYPAPPPPLPSKMAAVVAAAQQQHQHQIQQQPTPNSGGSMTPVSPATAAPTSTSPKATRAGILGAAKRPSMSSLRSHSNNNSFNNRGSSERILSVQESFDSSYEVRLYDEATIDPTTARALSKRAPLNKGESLSDEASSTPVGAKKMVPQSLMIVNDPSSGPYFSRQPSMGGDLSPVQEQPVHDEQHAPLASGGQQSASPVSPENSKPQKIRFDISSDTQPKSSSNNNGKVQQPQSPSSPATTPSKQRSLLSIFKEKRVTLLEHVRAMSPTKSEHAPPLPPAPKHQQQQQPSGSNMSMATRPTDLLHHGPTPSNMRHPASGSNLIGNSGQMNVPQSMAGQQNKQMMMMAPQNQPGMMMAGGGIQLGGGGRPAAPPGRGRARGGGGSGGVGGPINANMLMGRVGGRGGD